MKERKTNDRMINADIKVKKRPKMKESTKPKKLLVQNPQVMNCEERKSKIKCKGRTKK